MSQFGYPTSDISTGAWTHSTGTSHFGVIDEASFSDTDYCQLNNQTANTFECRLNTLTDPVSSTGHIMHMRVKKTGSGTITLTAYLIENTTVRVTKALTLTTAYADVSYTLSAAEADSITDYTNLRIRFTGTCAASTRYCFVSWANLEIPDKPATQLAIDNATHTHAADGVALTQHNLLAVQNASHTHGADTIALVQHNVLAIADATHTHAAGNVTLTYHAPTSALTIQDASHGHTADNVTLTYHAAHYDLAVQNATHAHASDNVSLTQHSVLTISNATHGHSADTITLTYHQAQYALTIANATHAHSSDNVVLTPHTPSGTTLTIANATHGHYADNVTLTAYPPAPVALTIADAAHTHEADNIVLVYHEYHEPGEGILIYERGIAVGFAKGLHKGMEVIE